MKRSIIILIILSILIIPNKINAERLTLGEEEDYLEELKQKKREQDNEKALTEAEYKRVSNEIISITNEIEELTKQITKAEEEIEKSNIEIEEKKKEIDNILVFLQLSNGEKAYLEYIFEAKSFTDFIHRVSIVEQISKRNKELITELNNLIVQNNNLKKKNQENIKKQESKKSELKVKLASLGSKLEEIDDLGIKIEDEIELQENAIAELKEAGCVNRNDKISQCLDLQ